MPKLDTKTARAVHKAERGGGTLIPPGQYLAHLTECKVSPKNDKNGNPYWVWTFEVDESEFKGSKIRTNSGLAENQHFWLGTIFDAFEAKENTDTDTLVGKQVLLTIDQGEIQGGARKGQIRSEITNLQPKDAADAEDDEFEEGEGEEGDSESGDEEEDDF